MIFYPGLTPPCEYPLGPDRCQMVADFVARGGGFLMTGGYLSFAGFNGIARWHGTVIEEVLPDTISPHDDRAEVVAGFRFAVIDREHPTTAGLDWGQSSVHPLRLQPGAMKPVGHLAARYRDDPMLVTGQYGQGRTAAFMSEFAPHWAGDFPRWAGYGQFLGQMLEWLAR